MFLPVFFFVRRVGGGWVWGVVGAADRAHYSDAGSCNRSTKTNGFICI